MTDLLKFSKGNAKLGKNTLIFSLPAGKTCPGASFCKAFAVVNNGKRSIQDGPDAIFRCFAASSEVQYDAVFNSRAHNLELLMSNSSIDAMVSLIGRSLKHYRTKNHTLVRIHESGDFFSAAYLEAWNRVAMLHRDLRFYCYSKSLHLFIDTALSDNFYLTASCGGHYDHLIDAGYFPRFAKVFATDLEAELAGLEIDHDDSHCFGNKPFGLLVHGTQPKGSAMGKAIRERRKAGKFSGYSSTKVTIND